MAANGQGGIFGFGPQAGKEIAVGPLADPHWVYVKANEVSFAPNDDQRMVGNEIGSQPTPTGVYKAGISVAGGANFIPRLEDDLGWLILGTMGKLASNAPALVYGGILGGTSTIVKTTLQTISTGLGVIPTGGRKVSVRMLKGDNFTCTITITVTGTDSSDAAQTETYDFSAGPGVGQRSDGLDVNPAYGTVGYETIVGAKTFKTVTSIAIPADTGISTNKAYINVGYEDGVARVSNFTMDGAAPTAVKWMGFRKYVPPGDDGEPLGETYNDCKVLSLGFTFPNMGPIAASMAAAGRTFTMESSPSWAATPAFESFDTVPISSVIGGYIRTPFSGDEVLPIINAQIGWTNAPLDPRMERVYGSPYLDDVTIINRALTFKLTCKWKNPKLYRALITGSVSGSQWSSVPFTTRLDVLTLSPNYIPGSELQYGMRIQAQKVAMNMQGGVDLSGGDAVTMQFVGSAIDYGGTYAMISLINDKAAADYVWPTD